MSVLDEVPFKIPSGSLEKQLVTLPELTLSDLSQVFQENKFDFQLEKWVLTGLQRGYPSKTRAPLSHSPPEILPSCPPYWLMFSQQARGGNSSPGTNEVTKVTFVTSDSDEDDSYSGDAKCSLSKNILAPTSTRPSHFSTDSDLKRGPIKSSSLVQKPLCQPRSHSQGHRCGKTYQHPLCNVNRKSASPLPSCPGTKLPVEERPDKPALLSLGAPPRLAAAHTGSHTSILDSSAELLSALSQEEQNLLKAVMEQGYPLCAAISALQKTGQQSPEQILRYLMACDHLCELGYDENQVEEALEMFQNCETKAAEFLHLLSQFNEMGFQQNTIKEVLLVHENHQERALEELIMRVA